MWSTPENLRVLALCSVWLSDGTFKVTPPLFMQLYTIHGSYKERTFPLVYALLPTKTQEVYERVHPAVPSKIRESQPLFFGPTMFFIDFEQSAQNAIHKTFPRTIGS